MLPHSERGPRSVESEDKKHAALTGFEPGSLAYEADTLPVSHSLHGQNYNYNNAKTADSGRYVEFELKNGTCRSKRKGSCSRVLR